MWKNRSVAVRAALALIGTSVCGAYAQTTVEPASPAGNKFTGGQFADAYLACVRIPDGVARLRCFDSTSATLEIETPSATGSYSWSVVDTVKDGRHENLAVLGAADAVFSDSPAAKSKATLVVRCVDKETNVYFTFGRPIEMRTSSVAYQFDGGMTARMDMDASASGSSVGLWRREQAAPFAQYLAGSRNLAVKVVISDHVSVMASFDLAGAPEALAPFKAACKY